MENRYALEELYPHLFMNDARSMVSAMLKVDDEAARIKAKVAKPEHREMTIEEKREVAFRCVEEHQKREKEKAKIDKARAMQRKNLREFDPRVGIEERHLKVEEKRQSRINKITAEDRLEQLRAERQRLVEEILPEELEKIRTEVRQNAEEIKRQDLANRKRIKDLQDQERIARQKEELLLEMEQKKRNLLEHRMKQFVKTLHGFVSSRKTSIKLVTFQTLNNYTLSLKAKSLKISRKVRFKRLLRFLHLWRANTLKTKLAEEAEIFQAEQERLMYLNELAVKSHEFWLKRKAYEGLEKYASLMKTEKAQQLEAIKRRQKLENFMSFVKKRTEEEYMKKEAELEEERLRELKYKRQEMERLQIENLAKITVRSRETEQSSSIDIRSESRVYHRNKDVATDIDFQISQPFQHIGLDNEIQALQHENSKDLPSESSVKESVEQVKQTPKVSKEFLRMQQRQEERKLKRDALEAKYREKREREELQKKEAAQKVLEEEKKRKREVLEKKKQEEKAKKDLEVKKKHELNMLQEQQKIAGDHYCVALIRRHLQKWMKFHYNWQATVIKAEVFGDRAVKKIGFRLLASAVKVSIEEKERLELKRLEWAYGLYLHSLKARFYHHWVQIHYKIQDELIEKTQQRSNYLKRQIFTKWVDVIPELLDERYEQEKHESELIYKFRCSVMLPRTLSAWKHFVQDSKEEKLKELYTQSMWEKAQLWLSEANNP